MNHNIEIRPVLVAQLGDVAAVHMRAFPDSALTCLGLDAVRRYYQWLLLGPHEQTAIAAWIDGKMVGFLFGGCFRGAMRGFLKTNAPYLALVTLLKPWLITKSIFRERLSFGLDIFRKQQDLYAPNEPIRVRSGHKPRFVVLSVAVDPAAQGIGVGQLLMVEAEEIARVRGFERMSLTVHIDNDQAIRFYEKQGWWRLNTPNGELKGSMRKDLVQPVNELVPEDIEMIERIRPLPS